MMTSLRSEKVRTVVVVLLLISMQWPVIIEGKVYIKFKFTVILQTTLHIENSSKSFWEHLIVSMGEPQKRSLR